MQPAHIFDFHHFPLVSPSILSADLMDLKEDITSVLDAGADWIHFDVMDGHYVPNLTFGLPILEQIRIDFPGALLDVHLMITNPDEMAIEYARKGADLVTFHPATSKDPLELVKKLQKKTKVGVAVRPSEPLEILDPVIDEIDLVLLMSVEPGFSGQSFVPESFERLKSLREKLQTAHSYALIEVDGGVNGSNARQLVEAGAKVLVSGSFVFSHPDRESAIHQLKLQPDPILR